MKCKIDGCENEAYVKGFCKSCYGKNRRGTLNKRTRYMLNEIIIDVINGYAIVLLYDKNGNVRNEKCLIDIEDIDKVKNYKWSLFNTKENRVSTGKTSERIFIYNLIMDNLDKKFIIDHKNNNPLDNRKCNLRITDFNGNMKNKKKAKNNTSGVKGVHYCIKEEKWKAYINVNKKRINLGTFENKEDAIKARKIAEEKYYNIEGDDNE